MSVNPQTDPAGAAEFQAGKAAARESRKAFRQSPASAFVKTMQAAIRQYVEARGQSISRDDAVKGLEEELRGAWPKSVSKFTVACLSCDDTGYVERACWHDNRCGRKWCHDSHPSVEHAYVEPCICPAGDKKTRRQATTEDAIAAAGRTAKKRKPGSWRQVGA